EDRRDEAASFEAVSARLEWPDQELDVVHHMSRDEAKWDDGAGLAQAACVVGEQEAIERPENVEKIRQAVQIAAPDVLVELVPLMPLDELNDCIAKIDGRTPDGHV